MISRSVEEKQDVINKQLDRKTLSNDINFAEKSDSEVWNLFKKGSEASFIHIYKTYFYLLYNYGAQFTNDQFLIKDAIQELFIYIRKRRNNLSDTDNIKLYLFKILKRTILRSIKEQKARHRKDEAFVEFRFTFSIENHIINRQIDEENITKLNKALKKLSVHQREAIYYYFYQNLSYSEITSLMGFSHIKSTRNLIYKAIKALKSNF